MTLLERRLFIATNTVILAGIAWCLVFFILDIAGVAWSDDVFHVGADLATLGRIRSFSEADCRAVQAIAEKLCASHIPVKEEDDDMTIGLLSGDRIPKELAYLKPQAVRIRRQFLDIYLHKMPAGEDSILVRRDRVGVWVVETHEGNWKNEPKVIWSSMKADQAPEPASGLAPGRDPS